MAQQTALDFFLMKLVDLEIGKKFYPNQHQDLQDAFKQAKAMEKEQMIKARQDGLDNGFSNGSWDSNLYYNETYKQ